MTPGEWLLILGFALSSSIDNFGVGVSYGVTKIKIRFLPNLIIAIIAFAFSIIGIYFGGYISKIMPGTLSTVIAALFVFIIGVRIILITLTARRQSAGKRAASRKGLQTYLDDPEHADKDKSGEISVLEALVLGVAVSMNALTNGLGAGLMRLSPIYISTSAALFSFLAIWWGVVLGERVAHIRIGRLNLGQFGTVISGMILLLIAGHMVLSVISI